MKKPPHGKNSAHASQSNKRPRRPSKTVDPTVTLHLLSKARYRGSSKHKLHPQLFGLAPFQGDRGDATLCDDKGGFTPERMQAVPALLKRGITAGLIEAGARKIWSVDSDGQIYECMITNKTQHEYHGYPLRPEGENATLSLVYKQFSIWAHEHGSKEDKEAAFHCKVRYGFRE
jgi:hypothetical protein